MFYLAHEVAGIFLAFVHSFGLPAALFKNQEHFISENIIRNNEKCWKSIVSIVYDVLSDFN